MLIWGRVCETVFENNLIVSFILNLVLRVRFVEIVACVQVLMLPIVSNSIHATGELFSENIRIRKVYTLVHPGNAKGKRGILLYPPVAACLLSLFSKVNHLLLRS